MRVHDQTAEIDVPVKVWVALISLALALSGIAVNHGIWRGKADLRFEMQSEAQDEMKSLIGRIATDAEESSEKAIALLRQEERAREREDNQINMSILGMENGIQNNQKGINENNALLHQLVEELKSGN